MRNRNMTASSLLKSNLGGSFFFEDCHVLSSPEWWRSQRRCRMPLAVKAPWMVRCCLSGELGRLRTLGPPSEGDPELRRQRALHTCADAVQRCCHSAPARPRCATTKRTRTLPRPSPTRSAPQPLLRLREKMPLSHSREHWPQRRPVKRRQASHRHSRRSSCPPPQMWSPCPGMMPARRALCPASAILGATYPCCVCPARLAIAARVRFSFLELVSLLREAPPVLPSGLAQTLLVVAECEAHDALRDISAADRASAAALFRHARRPVAPIGRTVALHSPRRLPHSGSASSFSRVLRGRDCGRGCTESGERCPARTPTARHARHTATQSRRSPPLRSECADERVPACPPAAGDHDAAANATPAEVPDAAWLALDTMRAAVRAALTTALYNSSETRQSACRPLTQPLHRARKLFLLAPRMLLARTLHGAQGRKELLARAAAFHGLPTGRMGAVASRSTATQSAV